MLNTIKLSLMAFGRSVNHSLLKALANNILVAITLEITPPQQTPDPRPQLPQHTSASPKPMEDAHLSACDFPPLSQPSTPQYGQSQLRKQIPISQTSETGTLEEISKIPQEDQRTLSPYLDVVFVSPTIPNHE